MRKTRSLVVGIFGGLLVAVVAVGLKISATPAWSANEQVQHIDRTLKGDRLAPVSVRSGIAVKQPHDINRQIEPAPVPELMEGCEAVVSAIGDLPLAHVAGTCQT